MSRTKLAATLPFALLGALVCGVAIADSFVVDDVHSCVYFKIKRKDISYIYGRFNDVAGTIVIDEGDPTKSSFEITIQTASIDTDSKKRDGHLMSPDFFNAKQFPVITFKSKSVAAKDDVMHVTGDLSLHGKTGEVTIPVGQTGAADGIVGIATEFTIKRSDYGMDGMIPMIADEVHLMISMLGTSK